MALRLFEETAALQDFDPAYDRFGSNSALRLLGVAILVLRGAQIA